MKKHISRRKFLGQSACAAVGTSTLFSTLINLKAANAAAIANSAVYGGNDYKAMVCILLGGGNDSFNMLVPKTASEYNNYAASRSNLAIPSNDLLNINALNAGGINYGVHPSMTELQQLFNNGKAAFISNVGTLVEPVPDKFSFWNETVKLPLGLLSHSDQVMHWQTAFPHSRTSTGWAGKIGDLLGDMNSNPLVSMNISLSGTNTFQTGNNTIEFAIDAEEGSQGIYGYEEMYQFNESRTKAIDNMLDQTYSDVFKKTYVNTLKNAQQSHEVFSAELAKAPALNTSFEMDDWRMGQSMEMIAKVISARTGLGMCRQTFFVSFDGWDHHDELTNNQSAMLEVLSKSIGSFQDAMTEMGIGDKVTTFLISDFARTLSSNGNGTDHAWGGNVIVVGDHVNGQQIYGSYPDLSLNTNQDVGGGILIPTTSADEYFAELALWFGVPASELLTIFPNLGNFYNTNSGSPPIGFLNV